VPRWAALVRGAGFATGWARLVAALVGPPALALLPLWWLRLRVLGRQKLLIRALPDAVDLIVTTVEAGLAIDAALAEVGRETEGPLATN